VVATDAAAATGEPEVAEKGKPDADAAAKKPEAKK
jgi:hypothetical protein